mmetsp:Transcript_110959/g.312836  ORF Transcript_110959/g.312836 Transcript_110959/m.312836 type:complete len:272 (+) Transcript_110959:976-1791(+)
MLWMARSRGTNVRKNIRMNAKYANEKPPVKPFRTVLFSKTREIRIFQYSNTRTGTLLSSPPTAASARSRRYALVFVFSSSSFRRASILSSCATTALASGASSSSIGAASQTSASLQNSTVSSHQLLAVLAGGACGSTSAAGPARRRKCHAGVGPKCRPASNGRLRAWPVVEMPRRSAAMPAAASKATTDAEKPSAPAADGAPTRPGASSRVGCRRCSQAIRERPLKGEGATTNATAGERRTMNPRMSAGPPYAAILGDIAAVQTSPLRIRG